MINVVYLVIFLLGGSGVTSQSIPQVNMNQCQINARIFNTNKNNGAVANGYTSSLPNAQKAYCIVGVK